MRLTSIILILTAICSSCKEEVVRPNILFIMSDDHTSQAWGIYGGILQDYVKNDNIKRLAREGTVLNNAFCTNSICVPSRASILTGKYSHINDVYTLQDALEPDSNNIAKMLQGANYQTAIVGKWHLKKKPTGFDHFMVLPGQGVYQNPVLKTNENWQDDNKGGKRYEGFSADVITDYSINWLKEKDASKPFFLMTHFKATHGPFDFPARHADLYKDIELPEPTSLYEFGRGNGGRTFVGQKMERIGERMEFGTQNPDSYWGLAPELPFSMEGLTAIEKRKIVYQRMAKHFLRSGAAIDDNIGKLLDYLEQVGELDNTVVIYTADQGYFLGEHGFFDKRLMYEESMRMPFVIRYPKEVKANNRLDDIILNVDFFSLLADYANVDLPSSSQGKSFRKNLLGESVSDWRTSMYYRYWLHEEMRPAHFGIRNERYKLIFFYGHPLDMKGADSIITSPTWEFYDLANDPGEMTNAYNDPKYKTTIEAMKIELLKLREEVADSDANYPALQAIMKEHF